MPRQVRVFGAGHLFQDRFRSEPIEDEAYLLTVFRYNLRNPEQAGLCTASNYPWSSFQAYGREDDLCDTTVFQSYFISDAD